MDNNRRSQIRENLCVVFVVLGILGILGVLMALYLGCIAIAMNHMFEGVDTIVYDARSPNGNAQAVIIERDCGATTAWSYRVKIIPADVSLKLSRGDAGGIYPSVHWIDNRLLSITVTDKKNFAGVENECKDVTYTLTL